MYPSSVSLRSRTISLKRLLKDAFPTVLTIAHRIDLLRRFLNWATGYDQSVLAPVARRVQGLLGAGSDSCGERRILSRCAAAGAWGTYDVRSHSFSQLVEDARSARELGTYCGTRSHRVKAR
jgi:hypothetical protein